MLYQLLVYNKVIQLYVYIYILFEKIIFYYSLL